MATGVVTITGNTSGGPDGARTFGPFTTSASASVDETLVVALASGDNTITVPSGTSVAVIVGPNAATPTPNPPFGGTLKIKGVGGDTGIVISTYGPTKLDWSGATLGSPSPPASFIINASTTGATVSVWFM